MILEAVRSVMGRRVHSDGSGYNFATNERDMGFTVPDLRKATRVVRTLQAIRGVAVALVGPIKLR